MNGLQPATMPLKYLIRPYQKEMVLNHIKCLKLPLSGDFSMIVDNDFPLSYIDPLICGALGGALTYGPETTGMPKYKEETWQQYGFRVFGIMHGTPQWDYCFSTKWRYIDNTPEGASARLERCFYRGVPTHTIEMITSSDILSIVN